MGIDYSEVVTDLGTDRKRFRVVLKSGIAVLALALIAAVFWKIGWPGIRANLATIGPWFLGLVALNLVAQSAFVLALQAVLQPGSAAPPFSRLYAVYLMGDALNYVAPGSGEALKTHLLREVVGGEAALAAVTLHKHADLVAQSALALLGVGVALVRFDVPPVVAASAVLGALALVVLLLFMTWALARGAYSPILRRLGAWKFLSPRLKPFHSGAESVDARIRGFYSAHRKSFLFAILASFVGWCGGLLETRIVLALVAPSAGWSSALAIECLAMVLNNALLFIPGKLGGAEGVRTGVFVVVGLSLAQGAAYSLVRRTRELLWVLPGWLLLLRNRLRSQQSAGRSDDSLAGRV